MVQQVTWMDVVAKREFPPLRKDSEVGVAIIGGGLTGLLTAYALSEAGLNVAVFELRRIGAGVTAYTTAFATQTVDTPLPELVSMFGKRKAALVWQSGAQAIDLLERIIENENIDCEWMRCSASLYATNAKEWKHIEKEARVAQNLGLQADLRQRANIGFEHEGFLELKRQAKFHPLKFLFGLAEALDKRGVPIYEQTKIESVEGRGPILLKSGRSSIRADWSVMATHRPIGSQSVTRFKKGMYRSYVFEAQIPRDAIKEGMYLDAQNPYHYFRVDRGLSHDRLIFGGEDHRQDVPVNKEKSYRALQKHMAQILGPIPFTILRRWDGPILEPLDGLPLIGIMKPHQIVATAFSGSGITFAGVAALLSRDIILGKKNAWRDLFNPKRLPNFKHMFYRGRDYTAEFIGGAVKNTFGI